MPNAKAVTLAALIVIGLGLILSSTSAISIYASDVYPDVRTVPCTGNMTPQQCFTACPKGPQFSSPPNGYDDQYRSTCEGCSGPQTGTCWYFECPSGYVFTPGPSCHRASDKKEICFNNIDDDGDGLVDEGDCVPPSPITNESSTQGGIPLPDTLPGGTVPILDARLTVTKVVINDNNGTKEPSDFTIHVTGNNPSPSTFPGNPTGTKVSIGPGNYRVTETQDPNYITTYSSGCIGTIDLLQPKVCRISNNDKLISEPTQPGGLIEVPAQLTVTTSVKNNENGTKEPSDFTIQVTGNNPSPSTFTGTESGTKVMLGPGSYRVIETRDPGYATTYTAGCLGTIATTEKKICHIFNDDKAISTTTQLPAPVPVPVPVPVPQQSIPGPNTTIPTIPQGDGDMDAPQPPIVEEEPVLPCLEDQVLDEESGMCVPIEPEAAEPEEPQVEEDQQPSEENGSEDNNDN